MDFQSAMETFAEAWVAANTKPLADVAPPQSQAMALTSRVCKASPSGTPPAGLQLLHRAPSEPPAQTAVPPPRFSDVAAKESGYEATKANCGKSLPVHCIVESVTAIDEATWRRKAQVETDSYVIIPVNTAFHELVNVALHRLNYPNYLFSSAKGCLVINNWKPLSFDKISDSSMNTVGDILGELTTVATLKIQIFKPRQSVLSEVKDKLLKLLLTQSQGLLLSTGCPLDEVTLSHLCRSPPASPGSPSSLPEPSDECRRKFDHWWSMQLTNQQAAHRSHVIHHSPATHPRYSPVAGSHSPSKLLQERAQSLDGVHPALQTVSSQYPTQKTRMRTSFDPELELPKLQRWFSENQHPSRQQIQQYVKELNGLESRRGRKPLDVNNVVYWFKNARAAQKRAELRQTPAGGMMGMQGMGGMSGITGIMGMPSTGLNGYSSASHSPHSPGLLGPRGPLLSPNSSNAHQMFAMQDQTSENSDTEVGANSEADDDDEMANSLIEEAPLSLTTNKSPHPRTPPVDGIKQEPPDNLSIVNNNNTNNNNNNNNNNTNNTNNNNNNHNHKDMDDLSEEEEEEDDEDDSDERKEEHGSFGSPSPTELVVARPLSGSGSAAGFPLVPNSMFSHSIMYMSHYIPGLSGAGAGGGHGGHAGHGGHGGHGGHNMPNSATSSLGLNLSALDERRKRNRTFIDPVSEVPRLEQWFSLNTHPSHNLILKYTDELNRMAYRQKFPRLEPKNVQFWFKNRRAKCKRLKMSLFDSPQSVAPIGHVMPYGVSRD